jgi:hypothetical protein
MKTTLLALTIGLAFAGVANAQAPAAPTANQAVKFGFDEVSGWLTASAELVPADKYNYKPVATVRSFGQLMAHVADGMNWYCAEATKGKSEWSDKVEKGKIDKATVVAGLKQAIAGCGSAYGSTSARIDRLMGNVAHASLHYGNAITYLRMMGLKPPSS